MISKLSTIINYYVKKASEEVIILNVSHNRLDYEAFCVAVGLKLVCNPCAQFVCLYGALVDCRSIHESYSILAGVKAAFQS